MPVVYTYIPKKSYVITQASGDVELFEITDYLKKLINDDVFDTGYIEIVDFSETHDFNFALYENANVIHSLHRLNETRYYCGTIFIAERAFMQDINIFRVLDEDRKIAVSIVPTMDRALEIVQEHFARTQEVNIIRMPKRGSNDSEE